MPMTQESATKSALRREALRLFAERGYEAVSMRELAEAVGMRQGGIYNHFASKQALLADLMETHIQALLTSVEAALADADTIEAKLAGFADHHIRYHLDYPNDVFLAYMEIRSLEPENHNRIIGLRNDYEAILRAILEQGQRTGQFRIGDPAVATRMLLAMLTGVTVWYREGGGMSREDVIACYLQGALQSVGLEAPQKNTGPDRNPPKAG